MAENSKIEWTDATWNPLGGCTRVSEGCKNCYAEVMAARFSDPGQWGHGLAQRVKPPGGGTDHRWTGKVALAEHKIDQPLRWRRPRRIFVNSTSDLFHEKVPDEWIDRIFAVMALCPQHTFQVLTKRPERAREYLNTSSQRVWAEVRDLCDKWGEGRLPVSLRTIDGDPYLFALGMAGAVWGGEIPWPLPNVWLGTSVEDQATADARIPELLATPAAIRFISAEPLLGPVDLEQAWHGESALEGECWGDCAWCEKGFPPLHNCQRGNGDWEKGRSGLDWVIVGGESGPGARPMHPDWARGLRDQCVAAGVPFFFKQWGEWAPGIFECDQNAEFYDGPTLYCDTDDGDDELSRHKGIVWNPETGQPEEFWTSLPDICFDGREIPAARRVGKKRAGRLLDGRTWDQMPGVANG